MFERRLIHLIPLTDHIPSSFSPPLFNAPPHSPTYPFAIPDPAHTSLPARIPHHLLPASCPLHPPEAPEWAQDNAKRMSQGGMKTRRARPCELQISTQQ
jgi:hypothetical protein